MKPLGHKSYQSIGHLPGSKLGQTDRYMPINQAKICTDKVRDKYDLIIVQEKLDGSNVAVANIEGNIVPLVRSGHVANSSPRKQHHYFFNWVMENYNRFDFLKPGQRICGEWLSQAHGTIYKLPHEPFVVFDIIENHLDKLSYSDFISLTNNRFVIPQTVHNGPSAISVDDALSKIDKSIHGCVDEIEGIVYRVERKGKPDFMGKWVNPNHIAGKYFDTDIWMWKP